MVLFYDNDSIVSIASSYILRRWLHLSDACANDHEVLGMRTRTILSGENMDLEDAPGSLALTYGAGTTSWLGVGLYQR